jgi:phosphate transport system protein
MPMTPEGFQHRIADLKAALAGQSRAVQALIEAAFDAAFARDEAAAARVIVMDDGVDTVDVQLERNAVGLLTDACAQGAALDAGSLRMVLTIVKVNNELERIADTGVAVAEMVRPMMATGVMLPDNFRVMTNSVVGILRDCSLSLERSDPHLAKVVLASEDAVEAFKRAVLRDAQVQVSTGRLNVDAAFVVHELATLCEIMAQHCTNIAEQALYASTGTIVRHMGGHWEEVPTPR